MNDLANELLAATQSRVTAPTDRINDANLKLKLVIDKAYQRLVGLYAKQRKSKVSKRYVLRQQEIFELENNLMYVKRVLPLAIDANAGDLLGASDDDMSGNESDLSGIPLSKDGQDDADESKVHKVNSALHMTYE